VPIDCEPIFHFQNHPDIHNEKDRRVAKAGRAGCVLRLKMLPVQLLTNAGKSVRLKVRAVYLAANCVQRLATAGQRWLNADETSVQDDAEFTFTRQS
jgi:hypothetical protein